MDHRQALSRAGVLEPPFEPLTGASHNQLLEPLQARRNRLGYSVSFEPLPDSAGGYCDSKAKHIVVDAAAPPSARVRVLVDELTHTLGVDYHHYSREQDEVIVDTVTDIVCAGAGSTSAASRSPTSPDGERTPP